MKDITSRLRGRYAMGPIADSGEPEFGYRNIGDPTPIMLEAADCIEALQRKVGDLQSVLYCLKRGTCFCEASIGNPMYTDHSKACKAATKALSSNKEQQ